MNELLAMFLTFLIMCTIIFTPVIIARIIYRRKYVDKETGLKKCGKCGKVTDPIFFTHAFFHVKYHCREHAFED
jgi:hypothetical protein